MISMKEIALEAGVSRATVSYVLNGKYRAGLKISEPVIRKVQTTAQRLGYVLHQHIGLSTEKNAAEKPQKYRKHPGADLSTGRAGNDFPGPAEFLKTGIRN